MHRVRCKKKIFIMINKMEAPESNNFIKSFIKRNKIRLSTFLIVCAIAVAILVVLIWGGVTDWKFIKDKETDAPYGIAPSA